MNVFFSKEIQQYFESNNNSRPLPLDYLKKVVYSDKFKEFDAKKLDEMWKICANADQNGDEALDYYEFKNFVST